MRHNTIKGLGAPPGSYSIPTARRQVIFNIDYYTYNKFIDCLLSNAKESPRSISSDSLYFFSTADRYEEKCSRSQLGAQLMRKKLLELEEQISENSNNTKLARELVTLIEECLAILTR